MSNGETGATFLNVGGFPAFEILNSSFIFRDRLSDIITSIQEIICGLSDKNIFVDLEDQGQGQIASKCCLGAKQCC